MRGFAQSLTARTPTTWPSFACAILERSPFTTRGPHTRFTFLNKKTVRIGFRTAPFQTPKCSARSFPVRVFSSASPARTPPTSGEWPSPCSFPAAPRFFSGVTSNQGSWFAAVLPSSPSLLQGREVPTQALSWAALRRFVSPSRRHPNLTLKRYTAELLNDYRRYT